MPKNLEKYLTRWPDFNFWVPQPKLCLFPWKFWELFWYATFSMLSLLLTTKCRISCHSFKGIVNIQQTKSWQISKELRILRVHEEVFHLLGWWGLPEFTSKLPSFNKVNAYFPVGKMIYWVGSFGQWAGWIYWVGKVIY